MTVTATPEPSAASTLPLGRHTLATIPARTSQVVIVRGAGPQSDAATVQLYEQGATGWTRIASWKGHVGKRGWTTHHMQGDLKTPAGTFTLTDAGGRRPDPGTHLPYYESAAFTPPPGEPGFGDATADAFDFVLAIDYNRVTGRSPLDAARPMGADRGGGIWIHVDHDGPTHGCVSIPKAGMRLLLRRLRTTADPVVVMGDADTLRT